MLEKKDLYLFLRVKTIFVVLLFVFSFNGYAGVDGKTLSHSNGDVFDFTLNNDKNDNVAILHPDEVEKIEREIAKIVANAPRAVTKGICKNGSKYNYEYCLLDIAPCSTYWDYYDGYSESHRDTRYTHYRTCTGSYQHTEYTGSTSEKEFRSVAKPGCCTNNGKASCDAAVVAWNPGRTCKFLYHEGNWPPSCMPASNGVNYPDAYYYDCGSYVYLNKCPSGWTLTTERGTTECKRTVTRYYTYNCCPSGWRSTGHNCAQDYTYYKYKCKNQPNIYGENWRISNSGGKSSYNPHSPHNNCRRRSFRCVADNHRKCAYVNNKWQCSPWRCNQDKKCGYAYCSGSNHSRYGNWEPRWNFYDIKNTSNGRCAEAKCDLVANEYISYCEKPVCPKGFGVYKKNGHCYKKSCPKGTYEYNGHCYKK